MQTGIAYPNCSNAQKDKEYDGPIAIDHMNGSPVEFHGSSIDFNTNDYKLVKLVVGKHKSCFEFNNRINGQCESSNNDKRCSW